MNDDTSNLRSEDLLCFSVYALNLAFSRFYQQAFGQTGFTYPKFLVLLALEYAGPMSLSAIAARTGAEPNTLSPLVKRMAAFDLLERIRDPEDERRIVISLKPYGRKVLAEAKEVVASGWDALSLPERDITRTIALLNETRKTLKKTPPARIMQRPDPDG